MFTLLSLGVVCYRTFCKASFPVAMHLISNFFADADYSKSGTSLEKIWNFELKIWTPFSCFKAVPNFWNRRRRRWLWWLLRHCKDYNTASSNLDLLTISFCNSEINKNCSLFFILPVSPLIQRPAGDHGGRDWRIISVWRWKTDW